MTKPRRKPNQTVGKWTLESFLGSGGNAEVWKAEDPAGSVVALKILFRTDAKAEPYRRFRQEVDFVEGLNGRPGVLPTLEFHIPETPSKQDPAWLAMPIAVPLEDALKGQGLSTVVEAFASFSTTLAALVSEFGASHRDIKPGNLYRWQDQWCIGDFGVVELPDLGDAITDTGRTIGPFYLHAPEVALNNPDVNYKPADVWSLAKSLWVLATDQNWPMQGHQPADVFGFRIQDTAVHPRARYLDQLIERCTNLRPEARPSMESVAEELAAWLLPPPEGEDEVDFARLGSDLRKKLNPEIESRNQLNARREQMYDCRDVFDEQLEPIRTALQNEYADLEFGYRDQFYDNWLGSNQAMGLPSVQESDYLADRIVTGQDFNPFIFWLARGVELLDTGVIRLSAFVGYGWENQTGGDQSPVFERTAPVGTVQADQAATDLVREVRDAIPEYLNGFVARLPGE